MAVISREAKCHPPSNWLTLLLTRSVGFWSLDHNTRLDHFNFKVALNKQTKPETHVFIRQYMTYFALNIERYNVVARDYDTLERHLTKLPVNPAIPTHPISATHNKDYMFADITDKEAIPDHAQNSTLVIFS